MEDSGIDSDPKITAHMDDDNAYAAGDSSSISSDDDDHRHHHHAVALRPVGPLQPKFTTKQLQRKLEARIEQAKRIQRNSKYTKLPDKEPLDARQSSASQAEPSSSQLIPIKKLPIPMKKKKHNALVEIWHSDSDSEDELFPMTKKKTRPKAEKKLQLQQQQQQQKQSMTDAFSIEEMSEDGSEDSLHLGSDSELHNRPGGYFGGCFACNCRVM